MADPKPDDVLFNVPKTKEMYEWARRHGAHDKEAAERLFKERYINLARRLAESLRLDEDEPDIEEAQYYERQAEAVENELKKGT